MKMTAGLESDTVGYLREYADAAEASGSRHWAIAMREAAKQLQQRNVDEKLEMEILRAQVAELLEAFTVVWVAADRSDWDAKAIEHFDALIENPRGETK